jgi:hypothetical protein
MRPQQLAPILAWSIALALGCGHENGPPPAPMAPAPSPVTVMPPAVTSHVGEGPIAVYGANVYSPGQEIYKALRQEDSLMAFLACQGEPDRLEVRENDDPGALPRIILEYTRRTLPQHGTVEIAPTASGYYAAHPIDPSGSLKSRPAKPSAESPTHPHKPAPKPKPAPDRPPSREQEPEREPEPPPPEAPAEASQPRRAIPEPTPAQLDECPIEPWRADCRNLCVPGASWEWCSYRD